jgi:hypothetical protein
MARDRTRLGAAGGRNAVMRIGEAVTGGQAQGVRLLLHSLHNLSDGMAFPRWLVILVALGATGCVAPLTADPPGPEVPRISQLVLEPKRVPYGCLVMMRFRVEAPPGESLRANVYWRVRRIRRGVGSRYVTLPLNPLMSTGKTSREVHAQLSPEQYGTTVWYAVQVEDSAGRKSNVLHAPILVDAPWPWETKPLACGDARLRQAE